MKMSSFVRLLAVLLVLAGAAWWLQHRPASAAAGPRAGSKALAMGDLNAIGRVQIISGTQKVDLVRSSNVWTVASLWGYPADFQRLAALLRKLDEIKVGEVIRGGVEHLEEFGLGPSNENGFVSARVVLQRDDGAGAGDIRLGQPRTSRASAEGFSFPDSQFARLGEGPVVLVDRYVDDIPRRPADWIDRVMLDLPAADLQRIDVHRAGGASYGVERIGRDGFEGRGTLAGQRINTPSADLWMRCLQHLPALDVVDPSTDPRALGFDAPDRVTAGTRDGLVIALELAGTNTSERYARVMVSYDAPPAPDAADTNAVAAAAAARDRARDLGLRVSPWTYVVQHSVAAQLTMLREQLVAAAPTNAPGAAP